MSVAVVKDKGAAVMNEVKTVFPPVVHILEALCCSPVCCSPSRALFRSCEVGALGTVQIMVGLFNIGLGPGRTSTHPEDLTDLGAAYWLGGVYITAGILSLVANQYPSRCFVNFSVFMDVVCSVFSVVGIVLYAIDLGEASVVWMCDNFGFTHDYDDNCRHVAYFAQRLLTAMDATLIILAALQLCVSISLVVLGVRALRYRTKEEGVTDVEISQLVKVMIPGAENQSSEHGGLI